jgi:hypothetical protein
METNGIGVLLLESFLDNRAADAIIPDKRKSAGQAARTAIVPMVAETRKPKVCSSAQRQNLFVEPHME